MPTYAYACKECDHAFDIQQSFVDDSLTVCPQCEGALRKKFNSVGVVFKGSGFYRNDSREAKSTTVPKADGGSKPASGGDTSPAGGSSSAGSSSDSKSSSSGSSSSGSASSSAGTSSSASNSSSAGKAAAN